MVRKRLDDSTLERLAEAICGGGPDYDAPGPYRSKSEVYRFFGRAGVAPRGESSTRKWFVLESLQALNHEESGTILPASLERVILRLASPQECESDAETTGKVIEHLNRLLVVEGLEIELRGVQPVLRERAPSVAQPKPRRPA